MMAYKGICRAGLKKFQSQGHFSVLALSLLLALALSPAKVWAETEISAAVTSNFPPYYTLNKEGQPEGFAIDIMNAIAKRSDMRMRYVIKPSWPEVAKALKKAIPATVQIIRKST